MPQWPGRDSSLPDGGQPLAHEAIYRATPGSVLVVRAEPDYEYGYWGEITTVAAIERGLAGLVIDGGVRDVQRIAELGFPVFSRSICIEGTVKNPAAQGVVGDDLLVGSVTVHNGDVVVGDADGIVVIARDAFGHVLKTAVNREAKERSTIEAIKSGERTIDRIRSQFESDRS